MEAETLQALEQIEAGAIFNGKLYKADKKGRYQTAYLSNVKYIIYFEDVEEFLLKAKSVKKVTVIETYETYGTGCVTTAAKAYKYGFDAIEY
jgi:hypothetical protein